MMHPLPPPPSPERGNEPERLKKPDQAKQKVAVLGARGYAGIELCGLLLRHPLVELVACAGSAAEPDWNPGDFLPEAEPTPFQVLGPEELLERAGAFDVVFLATPAEVSLRFAPRLLRAGASVIDLSGAFRLPGPDVPGSVSYGLLPWAGVLAPGKGPHLIANPGCYATAVLMALIPLLTHDLIHPETLVIDAKSGATGAGRKAEESLLFAEVDEDCRPYRVGMHQHLPEIIRHAPLLARKPGARLDPHFVTHLIPVRRGIIAGLYARLRDGVDLQAVAAAFREACAGYPLLRHGPAERAALVSLRRVVGSPRTQIAYSVHGDKLYLFSLIDNLLKGAASQAVENLNRILGSEPRFGREIPLTLGLEPEAQPDVETEAATETARGQWRGRWKESPS